MNKPVAHKRRGRPSMLMVLYVRVVKFLWGPMRAGKAAPKPRAAPLWEPVEEKEGVTQPGPPRTGEPPRGARRGRGSSRPLQPPARWSLQRLQSFVPHTFCAGESFPCLCVGSRSCSQKY